MHRLFPPLLAALLFLGLFTGCDQGEKAPILRIGTNIWPGYDPIYLSRDFGYLDDLPVTLVEYSNTTDVMRNYNNGAIQAATVTLDEALFLSRHNPELRIVLVMDYSSGGDVLMAKPQFHSLEELKDRRIGVEYNALGAFVLSRALETAGIDPEEVTVVPMVIDQHEEAYLAGKVDAVVTFEPVRTKLLEAGAAILFDSSQIPGEVVDVLVVNKNYMTSHPRVVRGLLDAWFRALKTMKAQPEKAAELVSRRLEIPAPEVPGLYKGLSFPSRKENLEMLTGNAPQLAKNARKLFDFMHPRGLLPPGSRCCDLIEPDAVLPLYR